MRVIVDHGAGVYHISDKNKPVPDDLLLLCSDGLSSTLREEEITHLLNQPASLYEMSEQLIQAAITAGGKDHITAVLVRL